MAAISRLRVAADRRVDLTVPLEIKLFFVEKLKGAHVFLVKFHACDRFARHGLQRVALLFLSLQQVLSQGKALDFDLFDSIWILLHAVV